MGDEALSPGDVMRRLRDLEKEVERLAAARRLEAATIGSGGLTVRGGGEVVVIDDLGRRVIRLGRVPQEGGGTVPGLVVYRTDEEGRVALSSYDGVIALWDKESNIVVSTDEMSGQGIARPWLPVPWSGSDVTLWPGTTSSSFAAVAGAAIPRQQPRIMVRIGHTTDVSGTTGEVRLQCQSEQLGDTVSVGFGVGYVDILADLPPGVFGETIGLSVDCRRTGGSGSVRAMVTASWTQQS